MEIPEDYIKDVEAEYSTAGHKKFLRYFEEVVNTKPFQEEISRLREKYKIPINGFTTSNRIYPPEDWVYRSSKERVRFNRELEKLCERNNLHYMDSSLLLEPYIFYNELDLKDVVYERGVFNLFHVSDLAEEAKEPFGKSFRDSDNLAYPVAVRISPYASLRDILDFVKKVYKRSILPMQEQYRIKGVRIGKSKKRKSSIKERNDFIYQNRHLPRKEIMRLIGDKFGENSVIDYAYIGKIISLEKMRRKEV